VAIDLHSVMQAANELDRGPRAASLKYALWIAALSPNKSLTENARAATVLARYVRHDLPRNPETLRHNLHRAGAGMVYGSMLDACYWVETCERFGMLARFEEVPHTYAAWVDWRDGLRAILKGHGYGYKVISFAGLLYAPLDCELVPVDRHVLRRFGIFTKSGNLRGTPQTRNPYMRVEARVIAERAENGYAHIPLALWHWVRWAEQRDGDTVESHAGLSCRCYL